ncbi:AAA-like domain-containing protein [Leptothoe kymatousa]|uniref:AAA-like domain-containing protein n=1 Tax=Leptothoe kymatousa TAU-MAC 1615 TaxID=2364775 RepID=A0ABS5XZR8_9CYAN|nr:AAA-like domain-containing protein [Leptothoe kymatousa]MBT9311097.1 AAA-like domain-containing protein [Leptothoe kymatousa TAU-MAC 1615]
MGLTLRASEAGLLIVDAARKQRGWTKRAEIWCDKAEVRPTTLRRFWAGEKIKENNFINICTAVGINNHESIASDNFLYIERPAVETAAYQCIMQPGSLLRIKGSKKMGKTELLHWLFDCPAIEKYYKPYLNFMGVSQDALDNVNMFLQWFCRKISEQLDINPTIVDTSWNPELGSNDNCTAYLERVIFPKLNAPLAIFLDNVDEVFPYAHTATDFFRLLRSWHDDARILPGWNNLRLIIVHSTDIYLDLEVNHSPFNVGTCIELPDFSRNDVIELARRYNVALQTDQINQLMAIIGGHPYLVTIALSTLRNNPELTLTTFLATAHTPAGHYYNDFLRKIEALLMRHPTSVDLLRQILAADHPILVDRDQGFRLRSLGLLRWHGDKAEPRCHLYRLYFQACLSQ